MAQDIQEKQVPSPPDVSKSLSTSGSSAVASAASTVNTGSDTPAVPQSVVATTSAPAPKIVLGFKLFCHGVDVDRKGRARHPPLPRHPNVFQRWFDCGNPLTPVAIDGRDVQLVCKKCGATARCNRLTGCEFHRTEKITIDDPLKCWCGQDYQTSTSYIGMKLVLVTQCPSEHAWWFAPIEDDIETQIAANASVEEEVEA